jgi:hypothetical protein
MATPFSPNLWPPTEPGFKRHTGPTQQSSLTTFEKIVRYSERNDILLYATAIFGIVMPAIMYFVYKAAHSKYQVYAKVRYRRLNLYSLLVFSGNVKRKERSAQNNVPLPYFI